MSALNPPGRRQVIVTTTIKNDPATLAASQTAYRDGVAAIRHVKANGISWTLVLQSFLPEWISKGDPNPLNLDKCTKDGPLVNVQFTINWADSRDDEFIHTAARRAIEQINAFAIAHGTDHPWRYLNYCAEWQRPFAGYGEENWKFLKETKRKYDPDGLFQRACTGVFELDV